MATYVPVVHASRGDRPDEADTLAVAGTVRDALLRLGCRADVVDLDPGLEGLHRLVAKRPALIFNLVEALDGDDSLAWTAAARMEALGLAFTGAGSTALRATTSKLAMKSVLQVCGLPTADWWTDTTPPADATVIVKSDTAHGSYGMDAASVVSGAITDAEIGARSRRFGGLFFAERYVSGREFNIALIEEEGGPRVLPIQEIRFDRYPAGRARIVDYEAKWNEACPAYWQSERQFGLEASDPELAARLTALALRCWSVFDMRGYARVDIRTDESGAPYILEVNPNPCLSPDAGFAVTAAQAGLSLDAVIERIVQSGLRVGEQRRTTCSASSS